VGEPDTPERGHVEGEGKDRRACLAGGGGAGERGQAADTHRAEDHVGVSGGVNSARMLTEAGNDGHTLAHRRR
jgi:hypothetical protein